MDERSYAGLNVLGMVGAHGLCEGGQPGHVKSAQCYNGC